METIYKPKRLRRAGAVFAAIFTMLLLSAFVANAQTTVLDLRIECYGVVKVKVAGNLEAYRVIQGPVASSAINLEGFSGSEIWYLKVMPLNGYEGFEFINWTGTDGADITPIVPGDISYPDPQGYQWKITMETDKQITANFGLIDLPDPGMEMSADFDIYTIPGTDVTAKGTPLVIPINALYPTMAPGSYPNVHVDALLHTNRVSGFNGLRILDISPLPVGYTIANPIELGTIPGVNCVNGNDILLSDIFDIIGDPSNFIPPLLESQSGYDIDWVFTIDGIMEGDDDEFQVRVSTIAYVNADVDLGACVDDLCFTELAFTLIDVYVNEVTQTLGPGAAPAPIQINQCDGNFIFNTTFTYPQIQNIDLAGEIKNNGTIVVDRAVSAGTTITWTYQQVAPPGGSQTGTFTVPVGGWAAGSTHYLSDIIVASVPPGVAPTPLAGHNGLGIKWTFNVLFPAAVCGSSGIYNLDLQPIVQLDGVDYTWGDVLEVKLINTKIVASLAIAPTTISAVTKAPIIVPVTTTFTCAPYSADHAGINLDGRITLSSYPAGAKILGVRANTVNVPLVTPYPAGVALSGPKKFSEIFASGWPTTVTSLTAPAVNWEFDIEGVSAPVTFTMTVDLFTYFDAIPPECVVATDNVSITFAHASFAATPTNQTVCLNDSIPITVTFDFPTIANIEPTAYDINTDVEITNTNHAIPAGTKIKWYYGGTAKGLFTVGAAIPIGSVTPLSAILAGSTGVVGTVPNKLINAVDVAWTFKFVVPGGFNPPTDLTGYDNAGLYTLTFKPIVELFSYADFVYMNTAGGTQVVNFTIPLYDLTMASDPDYAGTTNPAILPPGEFHEVGCGAYVHVTAEPSALGGWFFDHWESAGCPGLWPALGYDEFEDFESNPTWYRMPDCNTTVTAFFDQEEYEFIIGVTGCNQMVKVWDEAMSTVIDVLSGNRACADIEPTSGDELTFTHGETIWLEVIPTEGWAWGEWHYCDPFDTNDPLYEDEDFTYEGMMNGHHMYKLIFRSDKELMAVFRYILLADIVIEDKTYDGSTEATIDEAASSLSDYVFCATYDCTVDFDWSGAVAVFANKHASWDPIEEEYVDKMVYITGLALSGTDDCYYILGPPTYDEETGYAVPNTEETSAAKIFRKEVTVIASAANKVYDGNTNAVVTGSVTGFEPEDILPPPPPVATVWGTVNSPGQFNNKNVGVDKPVTYTVTLGGVDAPNYILPNPLPAIDADIICRPLDRINLIAVNREYDGTDVATIATGGWGAWETGVPNQGIVSPDVVGLVSTGYTAFFDTQFIGDDKVVTVNGLTIGSGGTGHTTDYLNYCLQVPSYGTGDIVPPAYAMFTPSYEVNNQLTNIVPCYDPLPVYDVKVEDPLFVEFNKNVKDFQNLTLPTVDLGEFVKLEKWVGGGDPDYGDESVGGNWVLIPAFSYRNGNEITIVPGTPTSPGTGIPINLEWETWYRLRFDDIWYNNTFTSALQEVIYRLDQNGFGEFDEEEPCALVESKQVIFKTISAIDSPVVEPSGCEEVTPGTPVIDPNAEYNDVIKVTFVNPVKYRNGNLISDIQGNPTHKFQLMGRPKGVGSYQPILFRADPHAFVQAPDGNWGPTEIWIIPLVNGGEMLHCYDYMVEWRDVNDLGPGFQDMTDGEQVGPVEWMWCTTCNFDIDVSFTANNAQVFPPTPILSQLPNNLIFGLSPSTPLKNLLLNGSPYSPNGRKLTYEVTMPTVYRFAPVIGQGYHIENWTRSGVSVWYNSGATPKWKYQNTNPGAGWALFTTQLTYLDWTADPAVPFSKYQFNVHYGINLYNILALASPNQTPGGSGVSFTGGTPFSNNTTKSAVMHGSNVTITARPKVGMYNTGWSFNPPPSGNTLPASVRATLTATDYTYDPCYYEKPDFVTPQDGIISFNMVGPDPVHNTTYTVQANFAPFRPRIDLAIDPESPDCNYVTYTTRFVQGEEWGIICAYQNYAAFYYGTPITLTPVECACGWEFEKFMVWDGTYEDERDYATRHYVDSDIEPGVEFFITENLDIIAVFKKATYHVTAVTSPNTKGSVLIEGVNADGDFVQLIDAAATAGDDFIYNTILDLTVYPEPGYEVKGWNNPLVFANGPAYIDRSYWTYEVGGHDPNSGTCGQPYDLVATIGLRQYLIVSKPYYYSTQTNVGGTVTGTPSSSSVVVNKFKNFTGTSEGYTQGMFEHFFPTPTQTFQLLATPKTYYKFSYWYDETYGNLGSANPLNLPTVNGPRTIRAIFVEDLPTYPLTVTHNPEVAGYEEVTQNGGYRSAPYNFYKHNQIPGFPSVIVVEAIPEIGWEFVSWTISGLTVPSGGWGTQDDMPVFTFNMPANAVNLIANWKKIDYTLDLVPRVYLRPVGGCNIVDYGITLTDVTPGGDGVYNFGQVVTLKAAPIPGFTFVNWMVGTLSGEPALSSEEGCILTGWQIDPKHAPRPYPQWMTFTYTIPAQWEEEVTLYALGVETAFPQYPIYDLTTEAEPSDKGVTWGDGNYPATVVAMVDQYETTPGWGFEGWSYNVIPDGPTGGKVNMIDGDEIATAYYGLNTYELCVEAIGNGSVWGGGEYNIESDPLEVGVNWNECNFEFQGWFYDYNCTEPVTDALGNPVTDEFFYWIPVVPLEDFCGCDITIFGLFTEFPFDVELAVARDECGGPAMGGTAEIIDGSSPGYVGEVVTLLATPAEGYLFEAWYDEYCDIVVEEAQFNHTIECWDNEFIAVFEAIPYQVNLSAVPTAGGTVAGGGTYFVGDNVTVTATTTVGWIFDGWFEGGILKSTNLAYAFTMPAANKTLEARWHISTVTLTVTVNPVGGGGSVIVKNGATVLTPPYTVNYGTVLTLDPEPNGLFLNWTGDLTGTANPASLTMNGNKAVTGNFATCNPPTAFAATSTAKSGTVTWTTPAGMTADLRYKLSTSGTWGAWGAATSPKTLTGLTPDKTYNVEIRTVCGTGIYSTSLAGNVITKKLGDVNCDGIIDVLDIITLTNYIMGSTPGNSCILDGGDINGDGFINVLDVVTLINIVLGQQGKASVMSVPADIYLTPGLIMFDSDGTLAGLQFEINGPQVRDLELTVNLEGFQLVYAVDGNTLTGMIFNMDNQPIPAGMVNLVSLIGEGVMEWGNVIGANYGESEVKVNKHGAIDDAFTLMVYPNPTRGEINALFSVPVDSKVNIRLLDFSGRVVSELTDAVYETGEHLLEWTNAQTLTTGLYILQMRATAEDSDQLYRREVKVVIIK